MNHFSYRDNDIDEANTDKNFPAAGINSMHELDFTLCLEENDVVGKWGNNTTRGARARVTRALVSFGWWRNDGPCTHLLFNATDGKKYRVLFLQVHDPDNLKDALVALGDLRDYDRPSMPRLNASIQVFVAMHGTHVHEQNRLTHEQNSLTHARVYWKIY
jgi:hypothetical protein